MKKVNASNVLTFFCAEMLFLVLIHFQVIPSNITSYPQISYTWGIKTPTLKFLWEHCDVHPALREYIFYCIQTSDVHPALSVLRLFLTLTSLSANQSVPHRFTKYSSVYRLLMSTQPFVKTFFTVFAITVLGSVLAGT